jgi:ABC-type polysaccharide/polyol phosphate transport system ATPase subunit
MTAEASIEVRNLTKVYRLYGGPSDRLLEVIDPRRRKYHREFAALDGISFTIPRGETVAFIGKNGSGKSTLLKMVTGILTPTSGSVQVRGKISALLELGTGFNPEMSGIDNVFFTGAIMGIPRPEMEKRIDDILAFADIGEHVRQPVKQFSSGMFVRLAFAVAVHVDPEILIIDEALAVGDMRFQQKCYRRIREFKDSGITILFVSHDMGAVNNFCDRCLWLKDGKIERDGVPVEVVRAYAAYMNYDAAEEAPPEPQQLEAQTTAVGSPWHDVTQCASFGDRGAEIKRVSLTRKQDGAGIEVLQGEQEVVFAMDVVFHQDIDDPLYGILVKDGYGNQVIGMNSFVYHFDTRPRKAGERVVFRFSFRWPLIRNGEYTLSAAIAAGTQDAHVEHHWVHDAIVVQVANHDLRQRLGCAVIVEAALSEEG